MITIDIEERFNKENTALRIDISATQKRPYAGNKHGIKITDEMVEYALKEALNQHINKE